jgi:hypothetical protein
LHHVSSSKLLEARFQNVLEVFELNTRILLAEAISRVNPVVQLANQSYDTNMRYRKLDNCGAWQKVEFDWTLQGLVNVKEDVTICSCIGK